MSRTTAERMAWAAAAMFCLTCMSSCLRQPSAGESVDIAYPVGDFTLIERDGRTVHAADLNGKVWIASFIFTNCTGPCPQVTATMRQLQSDFASEANVRLVTFTVDPKTDTPEKLSRYADRVGADAQRWLFLTGKEEDVNRLLRDGFQVGAEKNTAADATPGDAVNHDTHLAVVDRQGVIRGYYSGKVSLDGESSSNAIQDFENQQLLLHRKVAQLLGKDGRVEVFPTVNAGLNAVAGLLLLVGYGAIRRRLIKLHVACMASALAVSAVFLSSYLYFHLVVMHGQPTFFHEKWPEAPHWVEIAYLMLLTSHTLLAVVTAPLALFTAYLGVRGRLARHVWIARWTLPIWLYVSITGVVVYWMLYRLY